MIVIIIMGSTNVYLVYEVVNFSNEYDTIITNITTANSISLTVKPDIDTEMYMIVAGKTDFKDGKQFETLNNVNHKLDSMITNTDSPRAKIKLIGIQRTMQTLKE